MTNTKIGVFMDHVQVGTLPSTRVFFNLDVEPVIEFRNRLIEIGYKSPGGSADVAMNSAPVLEHVSFASLIANSESMVAKKAVLSTFTVSRIEEEDDFWFHSCTACQAEVLRTERKFKCETCNRSFPYADKRFRILVLADDKTHACNVLLMDRIVKQILGTTVTNMLNEMKKAPATSSVSEMYKKIIGKEISAKIILTEGNKNGDSNIYEAVELFDKTVNDSSSGDKSPETNPNTFSSSGIVQGIELFHTPGSAGSVSKKIKTVSITILLLPTHINAMKFYVMHLIVYTV
nr:PREDICTED: uncharacterized protein LOC108219397 isoform X1 [Daucus carota subsp. sativus]